MITLQQALLNPFLPSPAGLVKAVFPSGETQETRGLFLSFFYPAYLSPPSDKQNNWPESTVSLSLTHWICLPRQLCKAGHGAHSAGSPMWLHPPGLVTQSVGVFLRLHVWARSWAPHPWLRRFHNSHTAFCSLQPHSSTVYRGYYSSRPNFTPLPNV